MSGSQVAITEEMAVRIASTLGATAQYWLNLHNAVDSYDAEEQLAESDTTMVADAIRDGTASNHRDDRMQSAKLCRSPINCCQR